MEFLWKLVTVTVWVWAAYLLCDYSGLLELRFALLASFTAQGVVSFVLPRLARGRGRFLRVLLAPKWPNAPSPAFWAEVRAGLKEANSDFEDGRLNPTTGLRMNGRSIDARGHAYGD